MKKAFTLIELLVVIAIIAILAAILFPVFAQAKQAAKKTTDISSARQMGMAALLYAQDYDDHVPSHPDDNGAGWVTWTDWLQPYIKNYQVFRSVSYGGKFPIPDYWGLDRSKNFTWSINYEITGPAYDDSVEGNLTAIDKPSQTMFFVLSVSQFTWFKTQSWWNTWTCEDMILQNGSLYQVQDLETSSAGSSWHNLHDSKPIRASVPMTLADGSAKAVKLDNGLTRQFDANGKAIGRRFSGISCSVHQPD